MISGVSFRLTVYYLGIDSFFSRGVMIIVVENGHIQFSSWTRLFSFPLTLIHLGR